MMTTESSWLGFSFHQKNLLASLPAELITIILLELDWKALLSARATCKTLYDVSKTYTIWRGLFDRLSAEYAIPITPSKPIELHSPSELEHVVLKWIRSDLGWASEIKQPSQRIIRHSEYCAWFLVEGGRWLLTTGEDGSVLAYDLDAPAKAANVVIRPEDKQDQRQIADIAVYLDRYAPTLTFNIALTYVAPIEDEPEEPSRLSVWRVTLTEYSGDSRLVSTHLNSFNTRMNGIILDTSLRNNYYARIVGWIKTGLHIGVYDWERSNSYLHRLSVIWPDPKTLRVRLLPGRRLIAVGETSLMIFDIPQPSQQAACIDVHASDSKDTPLYVFQLDGQLGRGSVSPLYFGRYDEVYLCFASTRHLYAIMVPALGSSPPNVSVLADYEIQFRGTAYGPGLRRSLIRRGDKQAVMFNFLRTQGKTMKYFKWVHDYDVGRFPVIDEWSGKVIETLRDGTLIVIAFSV